MYKWYERYSYWVLILAVLYKLGLVDINVYPSVLFVMARTLVILFLKFRNRVPISITYLVYTAFVHTVTLLLVPHTFTWGDVAINVLLYGVYVASLSLYGKNVQQIYQKGVYVDSNKNLYEILKERGIL